MKPLSILYKGLKYIQHFNFKLSFNNFFQFNVENDEDKKEKINVNGKNLSKLDKTELIDKILNLRE